jgi:signal transduction histidine kinase
MAAQIHQKRCRSDHKDESLAVVLRQLALTEEQVKGLLSLGRHERKQPVPCDVNQLIGEVALLVGPACQHTHVDFQHASQVDDGRISGFPDDLRAAVLNLTLNGIDAAGPGGVVRLRVAAEDGSIHVEVSDNGPGPPPELREKLFDPFVTTKPEGVGLGLALARQVATDHGGRLAWTRDDGHTCFRLVLPRMAAGDLALDSRPSALDHSSPQP